MKSSSRTFTSAGTWVAGRAVRRVGAARRPRGYSLAFVVMILAVLGIAMSAFLYALTSSSKTTSSMLNRRRAFYACDGIGRIFVHLGQKYLEETPAPHTSDGLKGFICTTGGGCDDGNLLPRIRPDGYRVTEFNVSTGGSYTGIIPNGAFQDMQSLQSDVEFSIRAEKDGQGFVCKTDQSVTLGKISMFQFFVFSDGYADWLLPAPQEANGRVHVNGDFCAAVHSSSPLYIRKLTASGGIFHPGSSGNRCRLTSAAGQNLTDKSGPHISTDGSFDTSSSNWTKLTRNNDSTCNNCAGEGIAWADYAIKEWNGNVRDEAHGTPHLKLPISGTPNAQAGIDADFQIASNRENSKFLVDPVLSGDSNDVAHQKFACKADIRILNGVWYVRNDDGTPCGWPGTPIWSDHPGTFVQSSDYDDVEEVGQGNLYNDRGWSSSILGLRSVPAGYSYYQSDARGLGELLEPLFGSVRPVISYGALKKVSSSPNRWEPAHWVDGDNQDEMCNGGTASHGLHAVTHDGFCSSGTPVSRTARLLNAARSGFRDVQAASTYQPSADRAERSRVLPINFDVAAFAAALQNPDPGELRSYFAGAGREFNGIVYISNSWDGALDGMSTGQLPKLAPVQGARTDNAQPQQSDEHSQRALPYPLCASSSSTSLAPSHALTSGSASFVIPDCADYAGNDDTRPKTSANARPNALRIFHAATVSDSVFPKGLTIATNLPVYLLGNVNSSSNPSSADATPWTPVLVAADHVTVLSGAWSDERSGWHDGLNENWSARDASATTLNLAILTGWVPSAGGEFGGAINNFAAYMEDWSGVEQRFAGSIVLGFHSTYWRWRFANPHGLGSTYAYRPPNRNWGYDPHFDHIQKQPPGAPLYDVSSTLRWSR